MNKGDGTHLQNSRRNLLKAGAAATVATVMPGPQSVTSTWAKDPPPGPATLPFVDALPVRGAKAPEALYPPPTAYANTEKGECGRDSHQGFYKWPFKETYLLRVQVGRHKFHRDLPEQDIWGYDGMLPGPTIVAHYGEPMIVRIQNELPPYTPGFGSPEISTHLHNLHCASESDGFAANYYSATKYGETLSQPGRYSDHHYPNIYANADRVKPIGDPREALGTLWYHDHRVVFTAPNVYRGLAGFYLLFDDIDSGNENDSNPAALRLPSVCEAGVYDIPLMIQDFQFDSGGYLAFDQFATKGHLGNKFCVNGKIQPYFSVQPRKYRFRLLNGSPSRLYELYLVKDGVNQTFDYIANDGNLLPAPLKMNKVAFSPSERADIVIDFSQYAGSQLYLVNRLIQIDGRGPEDALTNVRDTSGDLIAAGTQILRFDVKSTPVADPSRVPPELRKLPPINLTEVVRTRRFEFDRENNVWTVNGGIFDAEKAVANPKLNTTELWILVGKGNWHHPVHIHQTEGRILSRNGVAPPPHERGRKDTYLLKPDETIRVLLRFSTFTGKYMMHCHNTLHEDHDMMIRFDIVS